MKWLIRCLRTWAYAAATDDDGEPIEPWPVWEGVWDGRIANGTRFGRPEWSFAQTTWGFPRVIPSRAQVVNYRPEWPYVAVAGTSRTHVERLLREKVAQMKAELGILT
jgi:hypothetical protein